MRAMIFERVGKPLVLRDIPIPMAGHGQILVKISACAACRTDLHVVDGELSEPKRPLVPGYEIVRRIATPGEGVQGLEIGEWVGIPWLGWTCGECLYCRAGQEYLCDRARFAGYTIDGGYAEWTVADARFCFPLPDGFDDAGCAPLLCAGLIGYRTLRMIGDAVRLGLYGFGAAAHIVRQVAHFQGREVFAFT